MGKINKQAIQNISQNVLLCVPENKESCFVTSVRARKLKFYYNNGFLRRERVPASDIDAKGSLLRDSVMKHM